MLSADADADADTADWGIVALAVAAGMIAAAHVGKAPPALPLLRADLGLSLVGAGWVVSVFSVTGMVTGMAAGTIADRVGHFRLLAVGLGALVAGGLAGAAADTAPVLLAARFLEGLGFVAVVVTAPSLIAAATGGRTRRLALGMWGSYMPAGVALMMVVSPVALASHGWRGLWLALAALTVLWLVLLYAHRRRMPTPTGRGADATTLSANIRLTVSRPAAWLLAFCFTLYTVQWISVMVWLPSFLVEQRGAGTGEAAALTALVVALNVPGNLAAGWLLHRGAPRWLLLAVATTTMGVAAVGIFAEGLPDALRYGLCLVFSGAGGLLPTAVLAAAPVVAPTPAQVGTTNGLLVQGSNLGQVIGPPLVAAVVAATGDWRGALVVLVGAAAVGTLLSLAVRATERR